MVSIIDALLSRNDVVVYDSDAHACIIDGLRLFPGKRFVFPHNDMQSCRKQLERATRWAERTGGGILVITEGVFGMAGDLGNLKGIVELKDEFNFRLLVDDAHGFGTMGKTGAGTGEHFGVQDKIDIYFSTFAKSMAGIGGFVAAEEEVILYLTYNLRSQIYAKSLPMPMVYGALKRLELLQSKPELKEKLWEVVNALQKGLRDMGFDIGKTESPVTPVYMVGGVPEAANLVFDLRENYGIFCSLVVYPVIPKGQILLRLIPTAVHSIDDVKVTIAAFAECRDKLLAGKYDKVKVSQF
jgi:glycine C-acetyltransferase